MNMCDLLPALSQEVLSMVVSVRRPNYRVDVIAGRSVAFEGNPSLMVELDEDDRTMYPVVENTLLISAAHPGKMCLLNVLFNLRQLYLGMPWPHAIDISANKVKQ